MQTRRKSIAGTPVYVRDVATVGLDSRVPSGIYSKDEVDDSVEGVVITEVKPNSPAAQKDVKPGEVIVEVTQEKVKQPQDVKTRVLAVQKSGRKSVLLLLSDAKGELRFVAVPTS